MLARADHGRCGLIARSLDPKDERHFLHYFTFFSVSACLRGEIARLSSARRFAVEITRTLRDNGHAAYLVGGCVRDLLLGREPADYDVATDAAPDEVMRIFPRTYAVGAQFGVVLIPVVENGTSS